TVCYGPSGAWLVCLDSVPTETVTLPATLDTDSSELCLKQQPRGWIEAGQPAACFVTGGMISTPVAPPMRTEARGKRPLVLVAHSLITVAIPLDVAGHRDENNKPPDAVAGCTFGQNPG